MNMPTIVLADFVILLHKDILLSQLIVYRIQKVFYSAIAVCDRIVKHPLIFTNIIKFIYNIIQPANDRVH